MWKYSLALKKKKKRFIYVFLAVLGLRRCVGLLLIAASGGCFPAVVRGLLAAVASAVAERGL